MPQSTTIFAEQAQPWTFETTSAPPPDWRAVDTALRSIAKRRAALDAEEARWLRAAEALQIWRELSPETFAALRQARQILESEHDRHLSDDELVATLCATVDAWYPGDLARRVRIAREAADAAKAKGQPAPAGPDPSALRAGPSAEQEHELLAKWRISIGTDHPK